MPEVEMICFWIGIILECGVKSPVSYAVEPVVIQIADEERRRQIRSSYITMHTTAHGRVCLSR